MTDFDLNAFLAEQTAEGTSEGGGEFTISHEKAAQKMSQYRLPREHAWVLKFVQAAVAWGCSEIKLSQTRTHSTFTFYTKDPGRLPTNQEIVGAILRADPHSDEPTAGFCAALRIVVERAHLSFLLRVDRAQEATQAIYAGVHFSDMGEKNRAKQRAQWDGSLNLRIHHVPHTDPNRLLLTYIPVKAHALPILRELDEYAYVSPIPIFVDGRRIDGMFRGNARRWSDSNRPVHLSGFDVPNSTCPPLEICPGFADRVLDSPTAPEAVGLENPKPPQAYLAMSIDWRHPLVGQKDRPQNSFLHWIRDGVLVDSERLKIVTRCLDLRIYLSAQGLTTDLTGFQLQRNQECLQRGDDALDAVEPILKWERATERDIFAQKHEESEESPDPLARLAKTLSALSRYLFTPPHLGDDAVKDKVRGFYVQDLTSLTERVESDEAAAPIKLESPIVAKKNPPKPVIAKPPSPYVYEGDSPNYVYDVQDKTTFEWVPPEDR